MFFFYSSNMKGIKFVHQYYALKNRGHRAQELKSIVTLCLVHLLKSNTVFSEYKRAYSPDYVIFMLSRGCPVRH